MPFINGQIGSSNVGNILSNNGSGADTLNGSPVTASMVFITVLTPATPISGGSSVPSVNPTTGVVRVNPGTPAGTYTITYQICEVGNPTNCDTAVVTIPVTAAPIDAVNDGPFSGTINVPFSGITTPSVLLNDTLNGNSITPSQVTLTMLTVSGPFLTLNANGTVSTNAVCPAGTHTLTYQICETLNPTNCDVATVTVIVIGGSTLNAVDDTIAVIALTNNTYSVLTNDTINGVPVAPNQVSVTQLSSTGSIGITANGTLGFSIPPPFPGTYTLTYQICDLLNPNSCDTATAVVTISACSVPVPSITSIIQPTCSNPNGSVNVSGLPSGNWTINLLVGGLVQSTINGSGTTTVLNNMLAGTYILSVTDGPCTSQSILFTIVESAGISITMQGTYNDFNNDGFTNVGDVINYQFTVTNNSCDTITNISLENNDLNISGGPLSSLAAGANDTTTFTASYILTQENINAGNVTNSILVLGTLNGVQVLNDAGTTNSLNISNGIKLNAFVDLNNNGIQDGTEQNVGVGNFYFQLNNGVTHTITSPNGMCFLYESNATNSYTVGYTINSFYSTYYTVTPSSYSNVTVANGSGITTYNFPITALPYTDASVYVFQNGAPPRPGFIYQNMIQITNNGNQTIPSGTLIFTANSVVTITSVSVSGTTPITNGFTYNYTNLAPNQSIYIYVTMQVPTIPTVTLGQTLTNTVSVSAPTNDINVLNNNSSITQTIVGSYDPNDKQESHGGRIVHAAFTSNDYLTYTIQFENTGTAEAINIRVEDVLDAQLDETSLRMVSASNPYVLDRVGSNLTWRFDGVNLPPSSPASTTIGHGYITFQIKPKAGYAIGDVIPNSANIYFDFNPAIVTNVCTTEFVTNLGAETLAFDNLKYYPNPVKNTLSISNSSIIDSIEITSILGQQMMNQKVTSLQTEVDLSELSNGIYFVKISSEGQEKTMKIIKE
jgi:uncharacterized repeat protein (TIGR01451 family)